ncbi:hypothetical protein [Brevibacillus porteri]|uniref:hypothetical protein n=1 Tax=Brevibacillus porteri TaxID=2126350 RepID=UPI003D1FEE13
MKKKKSNVKKFKKVNGKLVQYSYQAPNHYPSQITGCFRCCGRGWCGWCCPEQVI